MKTNILKRVGLFLLMLFASISSFANIPECFTGKWTDGNIIVEIMHDCGMHIYERGILIKEGSFTYDDNGFVETQWKKDLKPEDKYYFCLGLDGTTAWIAHEGGDFLTKLPDNIAYNENNEQKKDYSGDFNAKIFITDSEIFWKNISWIYGEWRIPENHPSGKSYAIKITPLYYQKVADIANSENIDFSKQQKIWYKPMIGCYDELCNVVYIDDLYLDFAAKRIYEIPGIDRRVYLEQTVEYATMKYILWTIAIMLGIGIILGVVFLVKWLIGLIVSITKKAIACTKRVLAWVKELGLKALTTAKTTIKKTNTNAKEQAINVMAKIKALWNQTWVKIACAICLLVLTLCISVDVEQDYDSPTSTGTDYEQENQSESNTNYYQYNNNKLSTSQTLKDEYRRLNLRLQSMEIRLTSARDYYEHQRIAKELQSIRNEITRLERKADAMGISLFP